MGAPFGLGLVGLLLATPASATEGATITVGSVVNGTSGGVLVGPPEVVRERALGALAGTGLPVVPPIRQSGGTIDAGDARFVVNGLVTGQACHRVSGWTGCRWRIRWDIYDRRMRTVVWRASAVGEGSVAQSNATSGMYHDIIVDSLRVVAGDPTLAKKLSQADPSPLPAPPTWDSVLTIALCATAPTRLDDLTGAFVRVGDSGSATVISPDGFALTSAQLLDGATEFPVTLSGSRPARANVVRLDDLSDIALVRIEGDARALPCVPPSRRTPAVGEAAISVVAAGDGIKTAAGGLTDEITVSGIRMLDATAAAYAIEPGGAVLDEQSHLVGIRVRPLEGERDHVLPSSEVPGRLGITAGEVSSDVSGVARRPQNNAVALGPVESTEPPILPPRPPPRTALGLTDIPGGPEMAIGGTMLGVGGTVALVSGTMWLIEESSWSDPPNRDTFAALTLGSAAFAASGAVLVGVGLRKQELDRERSAVSAQVIVGPSTVGVRGRF